MKPRVAILAAGAMGSALGARLTAAGVEVLTALAGRSAASRARAEAAGMRACAEADLAATDLFLSVVPPDAALPLAERMAPLLRRGVRPPLYVDCNAVNPETAARIAAAVEGAGLGFVDGGIIGPPPREGSSGTRLYVSGPRAGEVALLNDFGLSVPLLEGPAGAASALKMCYAGINKGVIAIASAMILAAGRNGAAEALHAELALSQATLLAGLGRSIPDMVPKAYRWAPEMSEIAGFLADDPAGEQVFAGFSRLYRRLADDRAAAGEEIEALARFLKTPDAT